MQLPPVSLSLWLLRCAAALPPHTFHMVSAASTRPTVSLSDPELVVPEPICIFLSQTLFHSVPVMLRVREAMAPSPISTTVPGPWLLVTAWCTVLPKAEGAKTCLYAKM